MPLHDQHAAKRGEPQNCITCRFFFPSPKCHATGGKTQIKDGHVSDHHTGDCRRFPPNGNYNGHQTVYIYGWCGEYKVDKLKVEHLFMLGDCCGRFNTQENHAPECKSLKDKKEK